MESKNNLKYLARIAMLCLLSCLAGCGLFEPPDERLAIPAAITFPRVIRSGTEIIIEVAYNNWWGGKFQGQPKEMHIEVEERKNNHYLISLIGSKWEDDDTWKVTVLRKSLGIGKDGRFHLTLKQSWESYEKDTEISFDLAIDDTIAYYRIESNTEGCWGEPYPIDTACIALYSNELLDNCVALDTLSFVRQENDGYLVEFERSEKELYYTIKRDATFLGKAEIEQGFRISSDDPYRCVEFTWKNQY